jgi:hypothetical protein
MAMGDTYPRLGGVARRLIDLRVHDAGHCVGWLEDDFHHFGVTIAHDSATITKVSVRSVRYPYSACPMADRALDGLISKPLVLRATDVGLMVAMRIQCTHMFDLAGLVIAHAAAGRQHRRYEAVTTDREIVGWEPGRRRLLGPGRAMLARDGVPVLEWSIDHRMITGPHTWRGQSLTAGFRERTEAMPIEDAECATVLRRAVMVAGGRSLDPDLFATARDRGQSGVCHSYLEENRDTAVRIVGSTLNYEASIDGMLSHLDEVP